MIWIPRATKGVEYDGLWIDDKCASFFNFDCILMLDRSQCFGSSTSFNLTLKGNKVIHTHLTAREK
jgi:hypothetical protein